MDVRSSGSKGHGSNGVRDSGSKGHGSNGVRDSESRESGVKESGTVRKVVHELKVDSVHGFPRLQSDLMLKNVVVSQSHEQISLMLKNVAVSQSHEVAIDN